jgi:hypothetical protein
MPADDRIAKEPVLSRAHHERINVFAKRDNGLDRPRRVNRYRIHALKTPRQNARLCVSQVIKGIIVLAAGKHDRDCGCQ